MSQCTSCGQENAATSRFCQACGAPMARQASPSEDVAIQRVCGSCGASNLAALKFCNACGSPLGMPGQGPVDQPTYIACAACGTNTAAGFSFCQHCGAALPGPAELRSSDAADTIGELPRAVSQVSAKSATLPPAEEPLLAEEPQSTEERDDTALTNQPLDEDTAPIQPAMAIELNPAQPAVGGDTMGPGARRGSVQPVLARFISVRRDGSDGEVHVIDEQQTDLGRTSGLLRFPDDPYLSERHCRISLSAEGSWSIEDLCTLNGVFIRIDDPNALEAEGHKLVDGDVLLIGKQVLRFCWLGEHEREITPASENGVMLFGSPLRKPWARLLQLSVAGVTRDVYHLYRPRLTLGREDGDLVFPDDEFMSRRHLMISLDGGQARIEDLGSSNGTFVRIRGKTPLLAGAMVRVGDQLLRFEPQQGLPAGTPSTRGGSGC